MLVQIFLKINRIDQAEKELKRIPRDEEDATLNQLATAWVYTAMVFKLF
jgi:coatomer protein complex subunit epsilon